MRTLFTARPMRSPTVVPCPLQGLRIRHSTSVSTSVDAAGLTMARAPRVPCETRRCASRLLASVRPVGSER